MYLEVEVHDELCRRLFLSFVKRAPTKASSNIEGKVLKVVLFLNLTASYPVYRY